MHRLPLTSLALACSGLLLTPACKSNVKTDANPELTWGDADWPDAPFPLPGGDGNGDGNDSGEDDWGGGASTTGVFTPDSDIGSVSECDPFAQDCPDGEKCVPYASTGGDFDANKCVPVTGAGMVGELCAYGGRVESTDDCDAVNYCWDASDQDGMLLGNCALFCTGSADDPVCPPGSECYIANEGSVNLCIESEAGTETGTESGDTGTETDTGDTGTGDTGMPDDPDPNFDPDQAPQADDHEEAMCPDAQEDVVLYMSNDDSNSQASPALVRRIIHEGGVVWPDKVRVHEFLNYYTIVAENQSDSPAELGMEMRRTDAALGEFTLLMYATGKEMRNEERAPLNLVFSIDASGSMGGEPMDYVKHSLTQLAAQLRVGDVISLVKWSNSQEVDLENYAVEGPSDPELLAAIDAITTGGGTDLDGGLVKAYELAEASYVAGGINRVVLMSDGGANVGETSVELIGEKAAANDGTGIYMIGVGVGNGVSYSDRLMDGVTDAGKGAYVFIDSPAEAELQFGERFLSNVSVVARNVSMRVTLPWYFGIKSFSGEEYSADPAEVEPQHLAPNDAMSFHQIIGACDPSSVNPEDSIEAHIEYLEPSTLEPMSATYSVKLGELVQQDATHLHKADVTVNFAKSLIVIGSMRKNGFHEVALETAIAMSEWLETAADKLDDAEVAEMAELMSEYRLTLQ